MRKSRREADKINRALTEGVGGLQFTAQAPPGLGRLIRIPFYKPNATANATAGLTAISGQALPLVAGAASTTHPIFEVNNNVLAMPAAGGIGPTELLQTPQISWAILRIVGFECDINWPVLPAGQVMEVCFQDLQIGGGATLFVHEDWGPGSIYLVGQDSFAGLRDYPILKSPNQAQVDCAAVGLGGISDPLLMSCNLVCEILQDDNFGAHIPGPYARSGALVRQGGSFVS